MTHHPGNHRGFAVPLALLAILLLALFFFGYHSFSQNEFRMLDRIVVYKQLEYLAHAGLNQAEDRLQQERWYGATATSGTLDLDLPPELAADATVRIHAYDHVQSTPREIVDAAGGKTTFYLLDHIKIYVEATYHGHRMYGYGKYIISPEPLADGKSTRGCDPAATAFPPPEVQTFRLLTNVRVLAAAELEARLPGFAGIADGPSRTALADLMEGQQQEYAKNFSRNHTLADKLRVLNAVQDRYSETELRNLIDPLDTAPVPPATPATWKNAFVLGNLREFFLRTDWDVKPAKKQQQLSQVSIQAIDVPAKSGDPAARALVRAVFGADFREAPIPPSWDGGQPQPAMDRFLADAGISANGFVNEAPRDLIDRLSKVIVAWSYTLDFKARKRYTRDEVQADGSVTTISYWESQTGAAVALECYNNRNHPDYEFTVLAKAGPQPVYAEYGMKRGGARCRVRDAMNLFLKYVDASAVAEALSLGYDKNSWAVVNHPPPPPGAGGGGGGGGAATVTGTVSGSF